MFKFKHVLITLITLFSCSVYSQNCSKISDSLERLHCYDENSDVNNEKKVPGLLEIIHQNVKSVLRDPSSAEFRNDTKYKSKQGDEFNCGEVNAKNGFGGYTGFNKYISNEHIYHIDSNSSHNIFDKFWEESCREDNEQEVFGDWAVYGRTLNRLAVTSHGGNSLFIRCKNHSFPALSVNLLPSPKKEGRNHPLNALFGSGDDTTIININNKGTRWQILPDKNSAEINMDKKRMRTLAWLTKANALNFQPKGYDGIPFSVDGMYEAIEKVREGCNNKHWEKYWDSQF